MRWRWPGDGHDRGAGLLRRSAWLALGAGVFLVPVACGSGSSGNGIAVRRLQDAALLAQGDKTRCPLDLELPKAVGGDVKPVADGAASGTPVGTAPAGNSLRPLGGASYRCAYQVNGKPVSLVVAVVPQGQEPVGAADAIASPLQEAGLDEAAARALIQSVQGAKAGKGVAAPSGSAAAATSTLPGGGAAAVALVGGPGGPSPAELAKGASKIAATLKG